MRKRVFWSILFSSILTLILTAVLITTVLYNDFISEQKKELITQSLYISEALNKTDIKYLTKIAEQSESRITLVAADGTVLYDSFADAATLENHLNRPEILEALQTGSGQETRRSGTIQERVYYYAVKLEDGTILRVSITTNSIFGVFTNTFGLILLIIIITAMIAIVSARTFTKKVVAPINTLNLESPLSNDTYEELSPLLLRMEKQTRKIEEQLQVLESKQKEFDAITENMKEALVIFSETKHVLSANKSAKNLFGIHNTDGIGYLELNRDVEYIQAVEKAFNGNSANEKINKNGRIYQISVNPVTENEHCAAVLFAIDITEKEQSETMRREFSANVSHELKTPLTSIMGYTEIMQNGIAKPEDYPKFIQQIYTESKRLLTLIDDIIKLSHLNEEKLKEEFQLVDLYAVSQTVIEELRRKAKVNHVELALEGENLSINGVERILYEIIFNLCDNAITYNKKHGKVFIGILETEGKTILSVKDTGIGIAPEHQSRVFERFYRVDKSRSKETGGTGLGLSIVKNGALLHNAEIELESEPDEGTTITLLFQK